MSKNSIIFEQFGLDEQFLVKIMLDLGDLHGNSHGACKTRVRWWATIKPTAE